MMTATHLGKSYVIQAHRGLLAISGPDLRSFLQGLVSNDVTRVAPDRAVYAALLTPQGKFLHDLFIAELDGALLVDCEAARRHDLVRRLKLYRLRAKVEIADRSEALVIAALIGETAGAAIGLAAEPGAAIPFAGGVAYTDPRLAAIGARAVLPRGTGIDRLAEASFAPAAMADYDRLRLTLGLPDGSRDMVVEKAILLESGFDELNGVDWQKGCYVGQELTARTKYRGLVKKRLMPVAIDGPAPEPGTPILCGGKEVGEMRSAVDGVGLALMRLESLDAATDAPLTAGAATLEPRKPDWAGF
jgi:folate-binding protein YgfZ